MPKKVAKARKDGHVHAHDDDEEMLLLDRKPSASSSRLQLRLEDDTAMAPPSQSNGDSKKPVPEDDSDTEESDTEELLLDKKGPPKSTNNNPMPTPARSSSPPSRGQAAVNDEDIDPQVAHGRIIGFTHPLKDFKANIATGDLVTKAVEDLGVVIIEVILRPFANRRKDEMLECMKQMRDVALKEDEIEGWNRWVLRRMSQASWLMRDFIDSCVS